jgi:predicted DNA-binding transcriptional regulator AlpA
LTDPRFETHQGAGTPVLEKLLDVFQVADLLAVSPDWVRSHANGSRQPELRCVSLGKLMRFRRADVEAFIENRLTVPKKSKFRIM